MTLLSEPVPQLDLDEIPVDGPSSWRMPTRGVSERVGWSVVTIGLFAGAMTAWAAAATFPAAGYLELAILVSALCALYRIWSAPTAPSRRVQGVILAAAVAVLACTAIGQILNAPYYGTDAVAYSQYQAQLVLHGHNPFTASLAPALDLFHVPVNYTTHYLNGGIITTASYPSGSFLFYIPGVLLGWNTQEAVVVDLGFWVVACIAMWAMLPAKLRWLAGAFLVWTTYGSFAIGGVTDTIYLPFLLLAVWRWDRYGVGDAGLARWVGPVALGVAMTVKQTPWFFAPFLLIGVMYEARSRGARPLVTAARYAAVAAAVFCALNLPWMIASPQAWFRDSLAPLISDFVPLGVGVVNLSMADRVGGGNLQFYSVAALGWVLAVLVAYVWRYNKLKRLWPVLVIVSFLFSPRSLSSYFVMLLPACLLAMVSTDPAVDNGPLADRFGWAFVPVLAVLAAVTSFTAVGSVIVGSPVDVRVLSVQTNGQIQEVTTAQVALHNRTGRPVRTDVAVQSGGYLSNFWRTRSGQMYVTLAPHSTRVISLYAPDTSSMPSAYTPFQVLAYTEQPKSVSASSYDLVSGDSVQITPRAVDGLVPVGKRITFTVQLQDRLGQPVHKGGVSIDLGEVTYAEQGLLGGTASIDGQSEGRSPVIGYTNRYGQVTYSVTGVQTSSVPTYFQAWLASTRNLPPRGYSQMVSVRFTSSR